MIYAIMLKKKEGALFNKELVSRHVDYLKTLDDEGRLVHAGPFKDGNGGMVVLRAQSFEEADKLARTDPFIKDGIEDYEVREWQLATRENNYLL